MDSGTYGLSLQFAVSPCATPITCGQTIVTNLSATSETDAYSVCGSAGEQLIVAVQEPGGSDVFNPTLGIRKPDGNLLTNKTEGSVSVTLPATGTYTILVYDDDYVETGDYGLTLTCLDHAHVTISASDANASEQGANIGRFVVRRSGPNGAALRVFYSVGGTATPGTDYTSLTGSVTIPAGQRSANITVTPIEDLQPECPETVVATLLADDSYTVCSPRRATVTIADNDLPTVTVVASDPNASEPGTDTGNIRVTRTGCTNVPLTVRYAVSGTATPGIDYSNLTGTVTIQVGFANAAIKVKPIDDLSPECGETVAVSLSTNAAYAIGALSNATVTIADNDLPTVTIVASDPNASEPGSNRGTFRVSRVGCTNGSLSVLYTLSGTATYGSDYTNKPGRAAAVTIPAGKTNVTITVYPKDDLLVEAAETVRIVLSNKPTYSVGSPSSATVTINDNDTAASASRRASTPGIASERGPVGANDSLARTLVNTWELKIRGSDQGTAFLTFHDDWTLTGYGITHGCVGVWTISGSWGTNDETAVVCKCVAQSGEETLWEGKLQVQVVGNVLLAAITSEEKTLKLRGEPVTDQPDLSGHWLAQVVMGDGTITEAYELTLYEEFPGMFRLEGDGAGPLNGAMIATSRNRVNAYMTGDSFGARSLWGKVDSTQQRMTLEGVDQNGTRIRISATKQ